MNNQEMNKENHGPGVDPQPGHGNDGKGHQDNGKGPGHGGVISKPGVSHGLTK